MDPLERRLPGGWQERRKGPDSLLRALRWMAGVGWMLMFAAMYFLDRGKPEVETYFTRWFNLRLRTTWNMELAGMLLYCMVLGLVLSLAGLVINFRRHRRRDDEVRISLLVLGALSLFGILLYFLTF